MIFLRVSLTLDEVFALIDVSSVGVDDGTDGNGQIKQPALLVVVLNGLHAARLVPGLKQQLFQPARNQTPVVVEQRHHHVVQSVAALFVWMTM